MGWMMGAGLALQAGQQLLGGDPRETDPNKIPPSAGFKSAGNVGDAGGVSKAPVSPIVPTAAKEPNEPATDPEGPKSKWEKVNQLMGSDVGKFATDVAGGFISDYRQQRNSKKNFKRLKNEGLTPVEIAGSSGGTVNAQGNTLGSGPSVQAKSQQDFQADQAQKERDNKVKVAEIGARAPGRQAGVSEARGGREQGKFQLELEKLREEIRRKKLDRINLWPMKLATMGRDNVMAAVAMFNSGLKPQRILTALGDLTESEKQAGEELLDVLIKISGSSGHLIGMAELFEQFTKKEGTLGRKDSFPILGRPQTREGKGSTSGRGATGSFRPGATGKWR